MFKVIDIPLALSFLNYKLSPITDEKLPLEENSLSHRTSSLCMCVVSSVDIREQTNDKRNPSTWEKDFLVPSWPCRC